VTPGAPAPERAPWPRWTARLRLTLWYGGLFLLAGLVLVGISYLLVRQQLMPSSAQGGGVVCIGAAGCRTLPPGAGIPPNQGAGTRGAPAGQGPVVQATTFKAAVLTDALWTFLRTMLLVLGLMALLSLGLGWLVAGRVLRPLQRITATAKRLSERTLHQRIALEGPDDELKELADTFDRMLARLDAAFDSQRRFAANASHELRTPLAISRTEVDLALEDPDASEAELRAMAERVRDANERSERLIEGLLTLARSEQEPRVWEPADLADAAAQAVEHARREGGTAGLRVVTGLRPAPVEGDPALLERMVANLVENAVRHNQPDGWLDVSTGISDGRAFVNVANGGRDIPTDQVEPLFEPFRRLNGRVASTSRGAGLGLSIVRSVARAHRGEARARALPGGGLEVTVQLPTCVSALPAPGERAATEAADQLGAPPQPPGPR
jgi:signal transduction histidine kinase